MNDASTGVLPAVPPRRHNSILYRVLVTGVLPALLLAACNRSLAQPSPVNEPVVITLAPTATPTATPPATPTLPPTQTATPSVTPMPTVTPTVMTTVAPSVTVSASAQTTVTVPASNQESPLAAADNVVAGSSVTTTNALTTSVDLSVTQAISPTAVMTVTPALSDTGTLTGTSAQTGGTVTSSVALTDVTQLNALLQQTIRATVNISTGNGLTGTADGSTPFILVPTPLPPAAAPPVPQPTPDGVARTVRVPILMYHYLSVPPADADIYRRDLSVPPELFAAHLDRMLAEGYTAISLYAFLDHLTLGTPLPPKPVIITFDDGYRDNYEHAFPLLAERNMPATFFVVTDFIDDARPEYLAWDMVREMAAGGMYIESHGRNHVSLAGKDDDYLVWQALGSLETIEYELGVRPRFISYPAGEYDQRTIDIFASANYWAGFTTRQGATHSNDDLFQLPRVRVRNTTSPDELIRLLELDW